MRWIPFILLVYVVMLIQTTIGRVLTFAGTSIGTIGPDLAAVAAVFFAMRLRDGAEAALAAWALGMAVDLTTSSGTGSATAVGPMPLAYCLAAAAIFRLREIFFRDRPASQATLALIFCTVAHFTWLNLQWAFAHWDYAGGVRRSWMLYNSILIQGMALSIYTAILMPLGFIILAKCERLFIAVQAGRPRRSRMGR